MLLTRPPLVTRRYPLDLHVLGPPLAFALSQDQTLQFDLLLYFVHHQRPKAPETHGINGLWYCLTRPRANQDTTHTFFLNFKDRRRCVEHHPFFVATRGPLSRRPSVARPVPVNCPVGAVKGGGIFLSRPFDRFRFPADRRPREPFDSREEPCHTSGRRSCAERMSASPVQPDYALPREPSRLVGFVRAPRGAATSSRPMLFEEHRAAFAARRWKPFKRCPWGHQQRDRHSDPRLVRNRDLPTDRRAIAYCGPPITAAL